MRTAGRMLATLFIRVPAVDCVGTEAGNGVQRCGEDRGEPRLIRHAKKKTASISSPENDLDPATRSLEIRPVSYYPVCIA